MGADEKEGQEEGKEGRREEKKRYEKDKNKARRRKEKKINKGEMGRSFSALQDSVSKLSNLSALGSAFVHLFMKVPSFLLLPNQKPFLYFLGWAPSSFPTTPTFALSLHSLSSVCVCVQPVNYLNPTTYRDPNRTRKRPGFNI